MRRALLILPILIVCAEARAQVPQPAVQSSHPVTVAVVADAPSASGAISRPQTIPETLPNEEAVPADSEGVVPEGTASLASSWTFETPSQPQVGFMLSAVGLTSMALGAVLWDIATSKVIASNMWCSRGRDEPLRCEAPGVERRKEARELAPFANAGILAGGALAAVGAILWFTAPTSPRDVSVNAQSSGTRVWIAPVVGSSTGIMAGATF